MPAGFLISSIAVARARIHSPGARWCALALCVAAPVAGRAQGVQSAAQSITLLAVKRPAVEALDAVHVTTQSSRRADAGTDVVIRVDVSVRDDGPCEIRLRRRSGSVATIMVVDLTGAERELLAESSLTLFRGECRESAPDHPVAFRVPGAAAVTPATHDVDLVYEVTGWAGGQSRRWFVDDTVRLRR